jgi:hypothetical protein
MNIQFTKERSEKDINREHERFQGHFSPYFEVNIFRASTIVKLVLALIQIIRLNKDCLSPWFILTHCSTKFSIENGTKQRALRTCFST